MLRASVLFAALLAAGCATQAADQAAAPPSGDCFQSSSVRGFSMVDNRHVRIDVGASRAYVLTTLWDAHDLDWTQAIAIRSASGFICTGSGLGVEVIGGRPQQRYPIAAIERAPEPAPQGS